jgi:hypothetical protein
MIGPMQPQILTRRKKEKKEKKEKGFNQQHPFIFA